jgi:hypothetical protein
MEFTKLLVVPTSQQCCILNQVVLVKTPPILMFALEEEFVTTTTNVVVNLVTQEIIVNLMFVLTFLLLIPEFAPEEDLVLRQTIALVEQDQVGTIARIMFAMELTLPIQMYVHQLELVSISINAIAHSDNLDSTVNLTSVIFFASNFSENYKIYPQSHPIFTNQTRNYTLSYEIDLHPILRSNLECRFGNSIFKGTTLNERQVSCEITIAGEESMSLWYSGNQSFSIVSNSILLKYLSSGNISFHSNSPQIGIAKANMNAVVSLNPQILTTNYQGRIKCLCNSTILKTTLSNEEDTFNCEVKFDIGIFKLELYFSNLNAYVIFNTSGIFHDKISILLNSTRQLNAIDVVEITFNTKELIDRRDMTIDCRDLIVTYKDKMINRNVLNCNSLSTNVKFQIQESIVSSSNYAIYYGNENQNSLNSVFSGSNVAINFTLIPSVTTLIPISTNNLTFIMLPNVQMIDISPKLSLLGSTAVSSLINSSMNEFLDLVSFDLVDGNSIFPANIVLNNVSTILKSNVTQKLNLYLRATYKSNQEKIIISSPSLFYFWSKNSIFNVRLHITGSCLSIY